MDGSPLAILVDAMPRGGPPGTLYVVEPTLDDPGGAAPSPHATEPVAVLSMVHAATGRLPRPRFVGCEPAALEAMAMGLVEPTCRLIESPLSEGR